MEHEIAQMLRKYKQEIVANWAKRIREIPNSRYANRPESELIASADKGVAAILDVYTALNYSKLTDYIAQVCNARIQMGFEIAEVSHALLLVREVVFPYMYEAFGHDPDMMLKAIKNIDEIVRYTISKFSEIFAESLNKRLRMNYHELREHEIRLHQQKRELERSYKEITSLMDSVRTMASTLDVDTVLNYIIEQACDLMDADNCAIYELDEISNELILRTSRGSLIQQAELNTAQKNAIIHELIYKAVCSRQVISCSDILIDKHLQSTPCYYFLVQQNIRALFVVPLINRNEVLGGIAVFYEHTNQFEKDYESLLTTFSNHAALAIKNARLYHKSRKAAILEERNRLAREIHDNLAQGLTAIVLKLEVIDRLLRKHPERVAKELDEAKRQARKNLEEARESVWDLRAGADEMLSLPEAIRIEIEKYRLASDLEINLGIEGIAPNITWEKSNHVFRIFQESLNNVIQHAKAQQVWIKLHFNNDLIDLNVTDDGIGLESVKDRQGDLAKGFGLMGMQERSRLINGILNISSSLGKGTVISLRVPVGMVEDSKPKFDRKRTR